MSEPKDNTTINDRAIIKLKRDMGSVMLDAFNDPETVEIVLNPNGSLWQKKFGTGWECIGSLRPAQGQAIVETVAGFHRQVVNYDSSRIDGVFPLAGARFAGLLPPSVDAPTFAVRKKATKVFTLQQYEDAGNLSAKHHAVLLKAVAEYKNILVIGGTGSGKTTFTNAIIAAMTAHNSNDRIITLEDTTELQSAAPNQVACYTSKSQDMEALVKGSLRMAPRRILVGEVRDKSALDLLEVWNTGHPGGAATIHGNSANEGLARLELLIRKSPHASAGIQKFIAGSLDFIVFLKELEDLPDKPRRVLEVLEVHDFEEGKYITTVH